ncbi:DUF2269 family protein [Amycolatopsis sp. NPDC051128]|uniref:DUF2269 family protein n=1 Tax=Amycolatopsis sp. NPDC051128 TaxID=3155412 RepID=UPI00343E316D
MSKFLLSVHVLAAVLAVGPVAVAASMFPAAIRRAAGGGDLAVVTMLHRICRVYAYAAIAVPVFGFGVAGTMHVMGDPWLIVSIGLTAVAAAVLALLVLPRQKRLLAELTGESTSDTLGSAAARLAMVTGVFNLLWAAVTVLMIVRPGSSTGA